MLKFTCKVDLSGFNAWSRKVQEQSRFASAQALDRTAAGVKDDITAALPRVFKSVVPFTSRALYVSRATKSSLTAAVAAKPKQAAYLYREIVGGPRDPAIEKLFAGVLPAGMFIVPTEFSKVTSQGKVSLAWARKLVTELVGSTSLVKKRRRVATPIPFIVVGDSKLHPGIWITQGAKTVPLLLFVKQPRYAKRFSFYELARESAQRRFPDEFRKALREAMASAR